MRAGALTVLLLLLTAPLTGCTGSDGEVNVDLTTEEIQELIDDNIDDFINNTTVTVVNHYHNNTTVDNTGTSSSSTTYNYNGSSNDSAEIMLKSSSGTMTGLESANDYLIDGFSLLVREDRFAAAASGNSASALDQANICVGIGTTTEGHMQGWFSSREISFTSVPVADAAEATAKFIDGSCDAMSMPTFSSAEEKKNQLDNDGSMGGVDIWVAALNSSNTGEAATTSGNSISITIYQPDDELISLVYLFSQVTLYGNCTNGSVGCSPVEHKFIPTDFTIRSTCSHDVSFNNSGLIDYEFLVIYQQSLGDRLDGWLPGTGLSCYHSINFEVSLSTEYTAGWDSSIHELSWGDWVYSAVWQSIPIE